MDLAPRKMLLAASPQDSPRSALHISQYSLPSTSRLPRVMIAAVAGFVLLTAVTYYVCKWIFSKKTAAAGSLTTDTESPPPPVPDSLEELQARVTKSLAQRLGSKLATAIPTVSYEELVKIRANSGGAAGVESEACAVCLTDFSKNPAGTRIKILPKCAHAFHPRCIDVWLMTQASCPICRASLFVAIAELNLTWTRGGGNGVGGGGGGGGEAHVCSSPSGTSSPPSPQPDHDRV